MTMRDTSFPGTSSLSRLFAARGLDTSGKEEKRKMYLAKSFVEAGSGKVESR